MFPVYSVTYVPGPYLRCAPLVCSMYCTSTPAGASVVRGSEPQAKAHGSASPALPSLDTRVFVTRVMRMWASFATGSAGSFREKLDRGPRRVSFSLERRE